MALGFWMCVIVVLLLETTGSIKVAKTLPSLVGWCPSSSSEQESGLLWEWGLLHPWSVMWGFSPDLDLLLDMEAAEEEHLEYLKYFEKAEEPCKWDLLIHQQASKCMAWWSFLAPPPDWCHALAIAITMILLAIIVVVMAIASVILAIAISQALWLLQLLHNCCIAWVHGGCDNDNCGDNCINCHCICIVITWTLMTCTAISLAMISSLQCVDCHAWLFGAWLQFFGVPLIWSTLWHCLLASEVPCEF